MSISVTVSGEDSTSVILSSVLTELVSISGGSSVDVVASSGNSAIITVSSGDPISITGNYSNFVTGQVVRPPEIADFLTENQINTKITTATGDYNTLAANTFYLDSNPSGFITGVDLSELEAATGNLDTRVNSNTANIVTANENIGAVGLSVDVNTSGIATNAANIITANEDIEANTSSIEDNSDAIADNTDNISNLTGVTGNFITDSETGLFYASSNPSGFITGVDLSSYVQDSETGLFLVSGEDASISALQVGSTPVFPYTRTVKLHDDGVQFGARLALIGTTDNGFPGIEMVTDGDLSKRTLIRHEGEGSNDYGISFFTTNNGVVAEKVRFDGDGNVGIGTASPTEALEVNGNILATSGDVSAQLSVLGDNPDYPRAGFKINSDGNAVNYGFSIRNDSATDSTTFLEIVNAADYSASTARALMMQSPTAFTIRCAKDNGNVAGTAMVFTTKGNQDAAITIPSDSTNVNFGGNVGIGTATPAAKLHIAGAAQNSYIEPRVENTAAVGAAGFAFINSNQEWKMGVNTADTFRIRDHGASTNPFVIEAGGAPDDSFHMDSNGNVGIGTASPDELLHLEATAIAGREVLMKATVSDAGNDQFGISNGTSTNNNFAPSFYGYKDSTYGNGYIYSLNFRGLVPDAQDTTQTNRFGIVHFEAFKTNNAADPNNGTFNSLTNRKLFTFSNGGNNVLEIDADNTVTISQDLSVSGDSSFSNRPTVNGTGVLLSGEGGGGTVENVVHTTGDQTISGTKSFGKISLSENSFVTETGSFTIGSTHRGATVLLENSAPMTVTIPAQVSGHTTTFIAETSNSVVFATGAGISGFNSFNSANQIAGIYGQAQIIFKSPEYAFLGGNVV